MKMRLSIEGCLLLSTFFYGQEAATVPVATQTLLNGVKTASSKAVIKSVLRIECPKDQAKGTGFVLANGGLITTNSHVVGTCGAADLIGYSSIKQEPVKFSALQKDDNRDIALLCPTVHLPFALRLSRAPEPPVESEVETWGYPLRYEGPAPVLSRGYVAGYTDGVDATGHPKQPRVRHLIVNGALNPGNSGGPLIDRSTGNVVGIVVEKWALFSPDVEKVIFALQHSPTRTSSSLAYAEASGNQRPLSNEEITAAALQERR